MEVTLFFQFDPLNLQIYIASQLSLILQPLWIFNLSFRMIRKLRKEERIANECPSQIKIWPWVRVVIQEAEPGVKRVSCPYPWYPFPRVLRWSICQSKYKLTSDFSKIKNSNIKSWNCRLVGGWRSLEALGKRDSLLLPSKELSEVLLDPVWDLLVDPNRFCHPVAVQHLVPINNWIKIEHEHDKPGPAPTEVQCQGPLIWHNAHTSQMEAEPPYLKRLLLKGSKR